MTIDVSFLKQFYLRFAPKAVLDTNDVNHWKETILYGFICFSLIGIVIMGAANFPSLIKHHYWVIISVITFSYLCCLMIFFFPTISYRKRANAASLIIFAVGISIIYSVGPFVSSREWLFSYTIIASVLLGWTGMILSILLNTITLVGIGILLKIGFWEGMLFTDKPFFFWFQVSSDIFFINIFTTLFVTSLFQKLEKSITEAKTASSLLFREQKKLLAANNRLKKEFQERKQTENKLRESEKLALVGQISGKIAHDFNNVLGVIMGNTELALFDCKDTEIKKTLELIFEQTIRGKNLTRNLVVFARDQEPKQEFFSINEKINLVVNLLRKDLDGIELIKEYKPGVPELLADPGMIEHALVNLIQNSIHALSMTEYPRISIRTYFSDENICFELEDNGCGIPKEYLESIYEPSFSLKGTQDVTGSYKDGIKGTGYGMANVKKYIEQHKGRLSGESKSGSGTKFSIFFPVFQKELSNEEIVELREKTVYVEKSILLVEDVKAISDVQYKVLTQDPFRHKVDLACNGQAAKDLWDKNRYDFISLDYILPGGINGMDVYHHIRATDQIVPVLFVSGNIEFLESIKELKHNDLNIDHISKPCQNKDFISRINELLKKSIKG